MAVRARDLGDNYQDVFFWLEAARLLYRRPAVVGVSLEKRLIRAFDDVVTHYGKPVIDAHNRLIKSEHAQLKFHVNNRQLIRATDLIDPAFIGASSVSLLERVRDAVRAGELPSRLSIITPWAIDPGDPLGELISNRTGEFVVDRLFEGGRRSRMGKLRKAWMGALGLENEGQLRPIIRHLRIWAARSQMQLEELFDDRLRLAGLSPYDRSVRVNPYPSLARRFIADQLHDWDAGSLRSACETEGLWVGLGEGEDDPEQLAIKSFSRFAATLEDEAEVLDLVPYFHGRELSTDVVWAELAELLDAFLTARIKSGERCDLHLDCHASLALAAGWMLQKADADVAPVQRGRSSRTVWRPTGRVDEPGWQHVVVELGGGADVAVAMSVTHRVLDDAVLYLRKHAPQVGRVLHLVVADGPSQTAVRDADHALSLAGQAAKSIREFRSERERSGRIHVFPAAPNGMLFFFGQAAAAVGPTTVYEYAFDQLRPGDYSPGISLPR